MERFIKGMINRKSAIILASVLMLFFGIYGYYTMPKQEMPNINTLYGYVEIIVPGYTADEIKTYVAEDVEDIVADYEAVDYYSTTCLDNAMIMYISMNLSNKNSREQFDAMENDLYNADLDDGISSIEIITDVSVAEVIYAVHSDTLSELEIEAVAEDLATELKGVSYVRNTIVDSAYKKEVVIEVDHKLLSQYPLTVKDVYGIIYASGVELPLGNLKIDQKDSSILLDAKYENLEEIESIILYADMTTGAMLTVGDIAVVSLENTDDKKTYEYNGETAAFVEMHFEADIDFTKVDEDIVSAVEAFESKIGEDVTITSVIFSPDHVKEQVNQVMINLLQCIGIVMLVVLIGLGVRNSMVIAVTIPVIVMSTIGILYLMNNALQLMSIAGLIISIGILVDNSIVISDAAQHHLDEGMSKKAACVAAVHENWLPVLTSTLTTVAAFAPLLTLPGIAGDVAYTLPLTLLISIVISFIAAMTLTPVLGSMMYKPHKKDKAGKQHNYKLLTKAIKVTLKLNILPTLLAFLVLVGLGITVITTQEIDLFPKTEKSIVYLDYEYSVINDNEGAYAFAKEIENVVIGQPDVIKYGFSQGGDLPQFNQIIEPVTSLPQYGRFVIEYDCSANELYDYMEQLSTDLEALSDSGDISVKRLELSAPIAPVQAILVSSDYEYLKEVSQEIFDQVTMLDSYDRGELKVADQKVDTVINIDRDMLNMYQMTLVEVQEQITIAVNGITDDLYLNQGYITPTRVVADIEDPDSLMELMLISSLGQEIMLSDVASYQAVDNESYVSYYNGTPSISIDAYVASGYSTYDLENDIKEIVDRTAGDNVTALYKGDNRTTEDVIGGILLALIIALIVIYFIMYFQFNSFLQPLIIFITIPLSFIGSLVAMLVLDEMITLTGLLGIVSLVGIVVNNGILLVENINRLRREGKSVYDSCILAANRRLRPIFLASLTTILGLVPLALFGGDFFRPMAVIFMGGLMLSTMLVIFMIPNLYYFCYKGVDKKQGIKH